jgi:hypothetical protein
MGIAIPDHVKELLDFVPALPNWSSKAPRAAPFKNSKTPSTSMSRRLNSLPET